ncbi:hypothetical protein N480_04930 [Pseudoalteromonas luteoviolacea S2607]|uniref:hypothetical protein n=1 Tax=Pseudoalteromonas luteoviolacea TaxID=43657 RepID=UPI0007B09D5F|nr:hypothetical protein [Pseudoalteromonas luteoviolacea]KZN30294.1 hypothetical protein N480_04930 [Pseudoalteromonas luteoviolacea S2607]
MSSNFQQYAKQKLSSDQGDISHNAQNSGELQKIVESFIEHHNTWIVRDRANWDLLWQEATAHYWHNFEDYQQVHSIFAKQEDPEVQYIHHNGTIYSSNFVFDIFIKLGVANITALPKQKVAFLFNDDVDGKISNSNQFIVVSGEFFFDAANAKSQPTYNAEKAFEDSNGWEDVSATLKIKVPPSDLYSYANPALFRNANQFNTQAQESLFNLIATLGENTLSEQINKLVTTAVNSVEINFDSSTFLHSVYSKAPEAVQRDFATLAANFNKPYSELDTTQLVNFFAQAYSLEQLISAAKTQSKTTTIAFDTYQKLHDLYQNVTKVDKDLKCEQLTALISFLNQISSNQAYTLSSYTALNLFFPFGFEMTQPFELNPVNGEKNNTDELAGLGTQVLTNLSQKFKAGVLQNPVKLAYNSAGYNTETIFGSPGDRGGAAGLDGDYAWSQFVPRMVAYNWNFNSLGLDDGKEKSLSDKAFSAMKTLFGYHVPQAINIEVQEAARLPFVFTDNTEKTRIWNIEEYLSELVIEFPNPPQGFFQPIALADFRAIRANEPFTCA